MVGVEMDNNGSLKAVCQRNGKRQLIGLIGLELPKPPPPAQSGLLPIGTGSAGDRARGWDGTSDAYEQFAWLGRCRRLAKDFENINQKALLYLRIASIRLILKKICTQI